jgi:hypothetical protein
MAVLTIPNTFVAGTPALASEVNANFAQIVSWSTGLDQDNMATFTGDLAFTMEMRFLFKIMVMMSLLK